MIAALWLMLGLIVVLVLLLIFLPTRQSTINDEDARQISEALLNEGFTAGVLNNTSTTSCTTYEWFDNVSFSDEGVARATPIDNPTCLLPNQASLALVTKTCQLDAAVVRSYPNAPTYCATVTGQRLEQGETITQYERCANIPACSDITVRVSLLWTGPTSSNCITVDDGVDLQPCSNVYDEIGTNQTFLLQGFPGLTVREGELPQFFSLRSATSNLYLSVSDRLTLSREPYYFAALPAIRQTETLTRSESLLPKGQVSLLETVTAYSAYNADAVVETDGVARVVRLNRYGPPTVPIELQSAGLNLLIL